MDRVYKAADSVVAREIAGDTLLVPVTGSLVDLQSIYALDEISAMVWRLLDGRHSVSEIIDAVIEEYDVTRETAESDVNDFISQLTERDLAKEA